MGKHLILHTTLIFLWIVVLKASEENTEHTERFLSEIQSFTFRSSELSLKNVKKMKKWEKTPSV